MNFNIVMKDQDALANWIKGWMDDCKAGRHIGIKTIEKVAEKIQDQYCTNGLWDSNARATYDILIKAADQGRKFYEELLTSTMKSEAA